MSAPVGIAVELARLKRRVSEVERRHENSFRHGVVSDVDAEKHRVRLYVGKGPDGTDQKSPWVPYAQFAGDLKVHTPPSVGQNMTIISPGGDLTQGFSLPFIWNNDNPSPSDNQDENVLTYGSVKITIKSDSIRFEVGGAVFQITEAGFAFSGGSMAHDDHDIGASHKHVEVMPGPGQTGIPIPGGPST